MIDPLVTTQWLAEWLDEPEVQILDATWFMPGQGKTGADSYAEGHIPGAVRFDIDAIADPSTELPHMLPSASEFAAMAGALGLRREHIIVVYDAQGLFSAPRVWWTLRVMGFPEVFVLDGGLRKWRAEGRPVEREPRHFPVAQLTSRIQPGLVCDLAAVSELIEGASAQIVDARPAGRFRGESPEPRAGLRSGHMPGARNLPWDAVVNSDGTMRSADQLRGLLAGAGIDLAAPIVTTCGSGVSASLLALALARLSRPDVAVYDGSWTEWGGRPDTPVVTGA